MGYRILITSLIMCLSACSTDRTSNDFRSVGTGQRPAENSGLALQEASGKVTISGSTSTYMPCSQTSTITSRVYEVRVKVAAAYKDEAGAAQVYRTTLTGSTTMPAGSGNGYNFEFPFTIPGARYIGAVNAIGRVEVTLHYGIHGTLKITEDGGAGAPGPTVAIQTFRSGFIIVDGGLTTFWGLAPDFESRSPPADIPDPAAPDLPATCYFSTQISGGTGIRGLLTNATTFNYNDAARLCGAAGAHIPSLAEFQADGSYLELPTGRIWTSSLWPANGERLVLNIPDWGLSTNNGWGSCLAVCKINGCPAGFSYKVAIAPLPTSKCTVGTLRTPVFGGVVIPVPTLSNPVSLPPAPMVPSKVTSIAN